MALLTEVYKDRVWCFKEPLSSTIEIMWNEIWEIKTNYERAGVTMSK
jgi:hypothetical protein